MMARHSELEVIVRTRKLWWRVGAFVAVAAGVLGFTSGPASALPRNCMDTISDYETVSAASDYWYGRYMADLSTNALFAEAYDHPRYVNFENQRIRLAQDIMELSC
jgi:hypothetical protein